MLLLTPEVCERAPRGLLEELGDAIDIVQVRPKPLGASRGPAPARATFELALEALDVLGTGENAPLVLVDDRVDVAAALWSRGVAGVHLGADDAPPRVARDLLGPAPLVGLSTHSLQEVVLAEDEPVDYLGFGPVNPTTTKGYEQGLGPERAWVASSAAPRPLFPIGGIDATNADTLAEVGRAAVGAVLLTAERPREVALALRAALSPE